MAKGESYHPQSIDNGINDMVPIKLQSLVKHWYKSKLKKTINIASDYYSSQICNKA
jgi:hypothetical protein